MSLYPIKVTIDHGDLGHFFYILLSLQEICVKVGILPKDDREISMLE